MTQFGLFISFIVFSFVSHYVVQGTISILDHTLIPDSTLSQWTNLIAFICVLCVYIYSIWAFCGWVVNSFN